MRFAFHKMHGLGNDFVVIDGRGGTVDIGEPRARAIADRHIGIGCDQLILLEDSARADVRMRIWNADGGEVEACGNATRCVATLLGATSTIETVGGLLSARADSGGARVELAAPRFDWGAIPLAYAMDTADMPVGWDTLQRPFAVNVGNPHIIFFVTEPVDLDRLGPLIETDPLFPDRINVNVATISGRDRIALRTWERGAGLTRACGTGACATAVAAISKGLTGERVTVSQAGGDLEIEWRPGGPIAMTGAATHVFSGEADWNAFG